MSQRRIHFTLNGRSAETFVAQQETLLEVLRRDFHLYSVRESCGQGLCGCCTVVVNQQAVSGCLYLAVFADGSTVETVENLGNPQQLHGIQEAFIAAGAFQCGFCTPGMILMTKQLLDENPNPSDADIKHYLSGNLCRCAAYPQIIDAVHACANHNASEGNDEA